MSNIGVLSNKKFSGVDELFHLAPENGAPHNQIVSLPLAQLRDFANHPFKVKNDEKMLETVQSIRDNGVLVPAIVRKVDDDNYEIISGHRRKKACEIIGLNEMPVIIRDLNDDEATIIMVDANLQRESLDFSEKAFAFKMKYDALKHQGSKSNSQTADLIGDECGESGRQIKRYIRLTHLIPELLEMVDQKRIGFIPAVELSYLSAEDQKLLHTKILEYSAIPSLSQAKQLRSYSSTRELTPALIDVILKKDSPKSEKIIFETEKIKAFFPAGTTKEDMEKIILKLLFDWKS